MKMLHSGAIPRRYDIIYSMNKEDFFIKEIGNGRFVGDDAAVIGKMCVSQDAFFENVHFKREWMSLYEIGRKAMLVNLSDAVAMNASPRYALLTVAMPPSMSRTEMRELARGLKETAQAYGVEIIGGDTIANTKLDLSITILADCPKPLKRKGIKPGDLLAYTGVLGQGNAGLKRALRGGRVAPKNRFRHPTLRGCFITHASRHLRVGMDISDGLFADLQKLSRLNRIGFLFDRPIDKRVGCSGEEYEMLVAFDPKELKTLQRIAARCRTKLTVFAKAARRGYRNPCKAHHF